MLATINERDFISGTKIGGKQPIFLIAGPCVMESRELLDEVCAEMKRICSNLGITYIFKSSFDKANRSSVNSYRGPGLLTGVKNLEHIKAKYDVPVLTDVHETEQVVALQDVIDIYQIPAFLCRQTDLVEACAKTQKWVNVKKGQFLSPWECKHIKTKIQESGSEKYLLTERGTTFGYQNLVFDLRTIPILQEMDVPVVFDATHSAQLPGGAGDITGGYRQYIPNLLQGAISQGIAGVFMEVHPDPPKAKSDSTTQLYLKDAEGLLSKIVKLDHFVKQEQ
ncbi:MAG: 3-deoxy-8-phosphooctulonate synthase [Spirochaetota bacterium]